MDCVEVVTIDSEGDICKSVMLTIRYMVDVDITAHGKMYVSIELFAFHILEVKTPVIYTNCEHDF
jgi:hypothetical protein